MRERRDGIFRSGGSVPLFFSMREDVSVLFERPLPRAEAQAVLDGMSRWDRAPARFEAVKLYSFAVPCVEAVAALVKLSPVLEVGAGSGHWAKLLLGAGVDVVATDLGKQSDFSRFWNGGPKVLQMDAAGAVRAYPDRNVFMCWPSDGEGWAAEAALAMRPGRTLAYLGEDSLNGCTADERFFEVLDSGFDEAGGVGIPRWECIHDYLRFYVRRGV